MKNTSIRLIACGVLATISGGCGLLKPTLPKQELSDLTAQRAEMALLTSGAEKMRCLDRLNSYFKAPSPLSTVLRVEVITDRTGVSSSGAIPYNIADAIASNLSSATRTLLVVDPAWIRESTLKHKFGGAPSMPKANYLISGDIGSYDEAVSTMTDEKSAGGDVRHKSGSASIETSVGEQRSNGLASVGIRVSSTENSIVIGSSRVGVLMTKTKEDSSYGLGFWGSILSLGGSAARSDNSPRQAALIAAGESATVLAIGKAFKLPAWRCLDGQLARPDPEQRTEMRQAFNQLSQIEKISRIQELLHKLGEDHLVIDGILGKRTAQAIHRHQPSWRDDDAILNVWEMLHSEVATLAVRSRDLAPATKGRAKGSLGFELNLEQLPDLMLPKQLVMTSRLGVDERHDVDLTNNPSARRQFMVPWSIGDQVIGWRLLGDHGAVLASGLERVTVATAGESRIKIVAPRI